MLAALSGREHSVFSGVAVFYQGRLQSGVAESRVAFRALEPAEIDAYVAGGEPLDKAGAYAVQGGAAQFVANIAGDFDNIVGLPLRLAAELLPDGVLTEKNKIIGKKLDKILKSCCIKGVKYNIIINNTFDSAHCNSR